MRYLRCTHKTTGEQRFFLRPDDAERVLGEEGGLDAWELESQYDPTWRLPGRAPDHRGRRPDHPDYQPPPWARHRDGRRRYG
ncbi:hypothetical protein [Prauserella muralis]|uniref:Uncharacterized protein n=1 Tax=Prauserella muralis TaxID=588067 RepID=A0A2V4AZS5_9PSEU|nr:hypothetical protein [Prauserella muralis]PXY27444.1 hypothetical protein BAY60_13500 [Prauserella muralis]